MRTWILWLVAGLVIVIGLVILLGPGLVVLMVAAIVPYVLVAFVAREQRIRQTNKCVEEYLHFRRHSHKTS